MKIGDLIMVKGVMYKILAQDSKNFYLNSLMDGGCIGHAAWTTAYLENYFAEEAIRYDVLNETVGIYRF